MSAFEPPRIATPQQLSRGSVVKPSPVFIGLCLGFVLFGLLLASGQRWGGIALFLFVVAGWVVSLALHEFGHAVVAYIGGDRSVVDKGYLTLDVRKYVDLQLSLVLPIAFLILGGIGLPGGAVWINVGAIKSKAMQSLMSAAGPIASGVCAVLCLVPIRLGLIDPESGLGIGMLFLGWIQVIAMIFNLLPFPGLDGFGIIEPHLPRHVLAAMRPYARYSIMALVALLWFYAPAMRFFIGVTDGVVDAIGGPDAFNARGGFAEFRFWEAN